MALIDNTTWSGQEAQGFYSDLLLGGTSRKLFRKELRVKGKRNINSLNITGAFLQEGECELTASGDYTLAPKQIEPCKYAFKIPFCGNDWEQNYLSAELANGQNADPNFPSSAIEYIFQKIGESIDTELDYLTFQGDTGSSPDHLCDGLVVQLQADGTVIDQAATPGELQTASTVIAGLTKIYNLIPKAVRKTGKVVIMVNVDTAAAYQLAVVSANPALVGYNQGNYGLNFIGIPLVVCPGMADDVAIAGIPENFVWATDLESDEMSIQLIQDPVNPKTSYAIGYFTFAVTYLVGKEVVLYS